MDEIKLELNPDLDIDPVDTAKVDVVVDENILEKEEKNPLTLDSLNEDEQKIVTDFVKQIDITNINQIITYGAASQNKIAQFSDTILQNVTTKDMGGAGELLTDLVVEIDNFDIDDGEHEGFFSNLFSNSKKTMDKNIAQYNKVEKNIDKISDALTEHQRQLLKDIEMYDLLFENNYVYFKELNLYIIAGREKLRELNEDIIPALKIKAEESGDEADAQKLNDTVNLANRFEKKIHDLMLSRTVSLQMAPQIRLIQNNDAQLVDKIQSSIVNAIPLWKNQMVIALGLAHSKEALEAQKMVSKTTNELLKKNAELLKQGSLEVAQESEESIISIETVKQTNQDLIDTINGIIEIQDKGREDRAKAEQELQIIEKDLKQALLSTTGR